MFFGVPFYDIMRTNKTTNKTKGKRMKKLLNISVIAALAILPVAANADITTTDPGATNANAPVAANAPKYSLATADTTDANLATAGYVKGAYNATIKAINKVATTANSAVQSVTEGATNGTVSVDGTDVAVHGLGSAAYTDSTAYATAAQGATADAVNTLVGNAAMGTTATTVTGAIAELKDAIDDVDTGVMAVTEGATNGTVSVDGTDVAVHGLGSAAYTDSTAYATAAQGATADAVNTLVGNAAMGTTATTVTGAIAELKDAIDDVDTGVMAVTEGATNGTVSVDGTDVAVHGLGSAAYTDSTAYATAAQGTKADNAETLLGNSAMGTTATTVTGAIAELKNASGDYATKAGVLATINASTVPVMAQWGSTTATTVSVDAPNSFVNQ